MDKEQTAIERLKAASDMSLRYYESPLVITDSGGKDSSVCTALAERAGIPFEVMHNHTTADAPETVYFVREKLHRLENKGIKCQIKPPRLQGPLYLHVELDPAKAHAADAARPLLLLGTKRAWRSWAVYHDGGTVGGVRKAEK